MGLQEEPIIKDRGRKSLKLADDASKDRLNLLQHPFSCTLGKLYWLEAMAWIFKLVTILSPKIDMKLFKCSKSIEAKSSDRIFNIEIDHNLSQNSKNCTLDSSDIQSPKAAKAQNCTLECLDLAQNEARIIFPQMSIDFSVLLDQL